MNEQRRRIALYVDLENFVGNCLSQGLPLDLTPEIEKLKELGSLAIAKSFGDIYKLPVSDETKHNLRRMLQNNLVQHEDIPYQSQFKNSADIRLVIEALSAAYTNRNLDVIAVVASDRDYMPLFSKLHEVGIEVIGIGGSKENTPDLYIKACDEFWYHETLLTRAAEPAPIVEVVAAPEPPKAEDLAVRKNNLVMHLRSWFEGKIRTSLLTFKDRVAIYEHLKSLDPDANYTLASFSDLIAQKLGYTENCPVFRVLYGLYRCDVFSCSPGYSPMNPMVHSLNEYHDDPAEYDRAFILCAMRAFKFELGRNIDAEVWSTVFYGNEKKAKLICEIAQSI